MHITSVSPEKKYLFEKAPYLKAILKLALPSILSQIILVIYNMADTFFIGQASKDIYFENAGLSNALIAGVIICMPVFMILSAISNLFGVGAASIMSRSMGKGNFERARNASRFAFWFCLITTLTYCLLILLFLKPITMYLSGYDSEVANFASEYILISVILFGLPTSLNACMSHLFRGEGKALHASIGIAIGGILNVILDPLFIFVLFPIEKAGFSCALATGISNTIALIYYLISYLRNRKNLVISFKFKLKMFNENLPKECLSIGLPACLMTLCENISYMILDNLMGTISKDVVITKAALAGIGAAKKVNMLSHSIVRGMTQGVLPLIGYNKTSGNKHRMRMIVYISAGISLGIATICTITSCLLSVPLSKIFLHEEQSISFASSFLIILSLGAPFSAIAYSTISFFQAVGKAWRSLILALLRKGILDIPLMFILKIFIPVKGIVLATPIADVICAIVSLILFFVYIKYYGHNKKIEQNNDIPIAY